MKEKKVLVVTGSFLIDEKSTFSSFLKKQFAKSSYASHEWLEHRIKSLVAEPVLLGEIEKASYRRGNYPHSPLNSFFKKRKNSEPPYLTEVLLTTLLDKENLKYTLATYDDLFSNPKNREKVLQDTDVVFASSTYLKDLSELLPVLNYLKRAHNRIVVGGALAGSICKDWEGHPDLDVLAIGYGEFLVPVLANWIKTDFTNLQPTSRGRLVQKEHSLFLYSGVPENLSLDFLPTPNWNLSQRDHDTKYKMIYYESVRGCPYRCAFCNYPYLFDDTKFRMKSAEKIAGDWEKYTKELDIEYITCLDSLFTMPKQRLVQFCNLLIERNIRVKWICYARADDLCEEEVVMLLKKAGCIQVQIGIESADLTVLQNMNKKINPEKNKLAILNCRKYGLTTVISLIIGFPGETENSIQTTLEFMKEAPPDFYFLVVFSVRVTEVPVLSDENKSKFGLRVMDTKSSMSPYWVHDTMDCVEATKWVAYMTDEIIKSKISLDAALFFKEILYYDSSLRQELLEFQYRAWTNRNWVRWIFKMVNRLIDSFLKKDFHIFLNTKK